jgi:two-component system phosphate regulon sensor histidine kinase PhoR
VNKKRIDQFFLARWKITILYFIFAVLIFAVRGYALDTTIRNLVHQVSNQPTSSTIEAALNQTEKKLWLARGETVIFLAFVSYFLASIATRSLKKSAVQQHKFIAQVSHELRTPLTIMKTSKEVALRHKDRLTREEVLNILESNLTEVDQMSQTIQFLLDFSDFENRYKNIAIHCVSLNTIIQKAVTLLSATAKKAQVALEVGGEVVEVKGNEVALEGVIVNLVKNAITHTPAGGSVTLKTSRINNQILVTISDTGKGIPSQDLPHIFKPFFKGSSTENQAKDGLGLGLSIVKEIIHLHHAKIKVSSIEHTGTIFTLIFPQP